jgi:hypothetical protein
VGADINLAFCRKLLQETFREVRAFEPRAMAGDAGAIRLRVGSASPTWLFQLPALPFYRSTTAFSWTGRADNAYHAKARGWSAWLEKYGRGKA